MVVFTDEQKPTQMPGLYRAYEKIRHHQVALHEPVLRRLNDPHHTTSSKERRNILTFLHLDHYPAELDGQRRRGWCLLIQPHLHIDSQRTCDHVFIDGTYLKKQCLLIMSAIDHVIAWHLYKTETSTATNSSSAQSSHR